MWSGGICIVKSQVFLSGKFETMMNSGFYQGTPFCLADPHCFLSEDVMQLINSYPMHEIPFCESDNEELSGTRKLSLFSKASLPEVNCENEHYVERSVEHPIVILADEACWNLFKKEISSVSNDVQRREILLLSWSPQMRMKSCHLDQEGRREGHEECGNLVKVSTLLNCAGNESWSEIRNFLKINIFPDLEETDPESSDVFGFVELDDEKDPLGQFEQFCQLAKHHYVLHWFQAINFGFVWKRSVGRFASTKTFRSLFHPIQYEEQKWLQALEQSNPRRNIVFMEGNAGMGKSAFLCRVAHFIKSQYNHRLVLWINLKRLDIILEKCAELKQVQILDILSFLHLINLYFGFDTGLERHILKCLMSSNADDKDEQWSPPKVEIFMDGLDQMSRRGRNLLLEYLHTEMNTTLGELNYRIWLSSRSHLKSMVENKLNIVGFRLDSFSIPDILQFLTRRGIIPMEWAKAICTPRMKSHVKIELSELLSNPQRLKGFETFLKKISAHPFQLKTVYVMKVLMDDVECCYIQNFCQGMDPTQTDDKVNVILRKHLPIALRTFMTHNISEPTSNFLDKDITDFGIVTKDHSGQLVFVNENYAAYIVADHYMRVMACSNLMTRDFFLKTFLFRDECEVIRMLYEQLLEDGINTDVCTSWYELLVNFIIETYDLHKDTSEHDRIHMSGNVIQLLIIDQRLKIVKLILRYFTPLYMTELRRLLKRKTRVGINSLKILRRSIVQGPSGCSKISGPPSPPEKSWNIELSSLSLAIMLGDAELVRNMYDALDVPDGENGDEHLMRYTFLDSFHFSPIHLAVIGCNLGVINFLNRNRKLSLNRLDLLGHSPFHLIFYNGWLLQITVELPGEDQDVLRKIRICKCIDDKEYTGFRKKTSVLTPDMGTNRPVLLSKVESGLEKSRLQFGNDVAHKDYSNPRFIYYLKPMSSYISLVDRLCGRSLANFRESTEGIWGNIDPPFHLACASGYLPLVEKMMEKGVKINIKNKTGHTALYAAIYKGQVAVVEHLLKSGIHLVDLDRTYDDMCFWLHLCSLKVPRMVKFLMIEFSWDVNLKGKDGRTPLHVACSSGCLETVKLLVSHGAEVDSRDNSGLTPLLRLCREGPEKCNLAIAELLIESGADVNAREKFSGHGPLHVAVRTGNVELARLLVKCNKVNVNLPGENAQTPLHLASRKGGNLEMLKCLVEEGGAGVEVEDSMGQTALMAFARYGNKDVEMALFLVKEGGMLHHTNKMGSTPIKELERKNSSVYIMLKKQFWESLGE